MYTTVALLLHIVIFRKDRSKDFKKKWKADTACLLWTFVGLSGDYRRIRASHSTIDCWRW
jgi:hypothetical protein